MKQTAIVSAVGLALVVLTLGGARLQAQPQAAPPASGAATGVAAPPPAVDKWNFADEEEAQPTLRQIVGAQATDLCCSRRS